jgi:hypothetical protein
MPSPDEVREAARKADIVVTSDGRVLAAPEDLGWYRRRGVNLTVRILDAPSDPVTARRDRSHG